MDTELIDPVGIEIEYMDLAKRYHTLNVKEMDRLLELRELIPDKIRHQILTDITASFPEVYRLRAKFKGSDED